MVATDRDDTITKYMYRTNRTGCDRKRDEEHRGESRGFAALAVLLAFGLLAALGLVAGVSLINENVAHHAAGGSRTVSSCCGECSFLTRNLIDHCS